MVNAILLRIQLSGRIDRLTDESVNLIQTGIQYYKETRSDRRGAIPFWPLGFSRYCENWAVLGLVGNERIYLAVWRRKGSDNSMKIPLNIIKGENIFRKCSYPSDSDTDAVWDECLGIFQLMLPNAPCVRIFEFWEEGR